MSKVAASFATALIVVVAQLPASANETKTSIDHGAMMEGMDDCGTPTGIGVINFLDIANSKINVTHEPVKSIGWPEMKMDFAVLKPIDLAAFSTGERIHFLLKAEKDNSYSIAAMCSLDIAADAHEACMTYMHGVAMNAAATAGHSCNMEGMSDKAAMDHSAHGAIEDEHKGHH